MYQLTSPSCLEYIGCLFENGKTASGENIKNGFQPATCGRGPRRDTGPAAPPVAAARVSNTRPAGSGGWANVSACGGCASAADRRPQDARPGHRGDSICGVGVGSRGRVPAGAVANTCICTPWAVCSTDAKVSGHARGARDTKESGKQEDHEKGLTGQSTPHGPAAFYWAYFNITCYQQKFLVAR